MLHFDPYNLSLNEKRLVYGVWKGGRYFARSSPSSSTTTTQKTTSTPTSSLSFGGTLTKQIQQSAGQTSPWSISRVQGGGGTSATPGSTGVLNFSAYNAPAPTSSLNELLKQGYSASKQMTIPSGTASFSTIKTSPPAGTVTVSPTSSPWNIAGARTAIGDAAGSLKTGYTPRLNFSAYESSLKAPTVPEEEKKEEEKKEEVPKPIETPTPAEPLSSIQNMILEAMKPTSEEQKLQEQIDTEIGSLELGLTDIEGRPMPMGLITGGQAQMERSASVRLAPLQRNLQRLQNMREAKLKSLETMYGFEEGALTRQFQKEQTDFTNRVALATKGLRYDPETDQFYRDDSLTAPEDEVEKAKLEEGLRKEFNGLQTVKEFNTIAVQYSRMRDAMNAYLEAKGTPEEMGLANFVDQALVVVFNKILDPGSVVRESEFARTPEGLAYLDRLEAWKNRIMKGGLLEDDSRRAAMDIATRFITSSKDQYDRTADFYEKIAAKSGLDIENIIYEPDLGLENYSDVTGTLPDAPPSNTGVQGDILYDLDADILRNLSLADLNTLYPELSPDQIIQRKQELANSGQDALQAYMVSLGL